MAEGALEEGTMQETSHDIEVSGARLQYNNWSYSYWIISDPVCRVMLWIGGTLCPGAKSKPN